MQEKCCTVGSETGQLKKVLLHRPGGEIARLTPENRSNLLFDDILWPENAQAEHDAFAALLKQNGAEVVYFADCLAHILRNKDVRSSLLDEAIALEPLDAALASALKASLMEIEALDLAEVLTAGMTKGEFHAQQGMVKSLVFSSLCDQQFLIHPLPNLYFQRDPYFFVNSCALLSVMNFTIRQREPLYGRYIFKHHPCFDGVNLCYGTDVRDVPPYTVEGGDVLVLSADCIAIGISERTSAAAVQMIGERLAKKAGIKTILAVKIPKERFCMHLDTVLTMVDRDAFAIYSPVCEKMQVWELHYGENGALCSLEESRDLKTALKKNLLLDHIRFIETGGSDPVLAAREQWHDGANTLAIAPGTVVTYNCNTHSNRVLSDNGIRVLEIEGADLGRGRGGPRCMSMPLFRDAVAP